MPDLEKVDCLYMARQAVLERISVSQTVCKTPVYLMGCIVEPGDADTEATVSLYDGESADDPHIVTLKATFAFPHHSVYCPWYFRRGLYVVIDTGATAITLQYIPVSE